MKLKDKLQLTKRNAFKTKVKACGTVSEGKFGKIQKKWISKYGYLG